MPVIRTLALVTWASAATAGVIHGVVLERASSRPLARARVKLEMLTGSRLEQVATTLANRGGQFTFLSLRDGYYVVSAGRTGFADASWGQKRPTGPGALIPVNGDSATFTEIQLQRLGAITGRILDENQVGLPGANVLAYPAALPLRPAATAKSDDRGVYRIPLLARGRYWVRTAAHELEDGSGLLPTFFPESTATREARVVAVDLDREVSDADVRPAPGKLFRLSGRTVGCGGQVNLTLSADTGRQQKTVFCSLPFTFENLSPGYYELLGEPAAAPDRSSASPQIAAFQELYLDRDHEGVNVQFTSPPRVLLELDSRTATGRLEIPLLARRKDLAGEGEIVQLMRDTTLLPGFWELTALPPSSQYLVSITAMPEPRRASRAGQSDNWFEVFLGAASYTRVRLQLSSKPAALRGRVLGGTDAVPGAPVYLYPANRELRRQLNGSRTARTDVRGEYRFEGLPPGNYLVLSSFDLDEVTEESLNEGRAKTVLIDEGRTNVEDLVLHRAP